MKQLDLTFINPVSFDRWWMMNPAAGASITRLNQPQVAANLARLAPRWRVRRGRVLRGAAGSTRPKEMCYTSYP